MSASPLTEKALYPDVHNMDMHHEDDDASLDEELCKTSQNTKKTRSKISTSVLARKGDSAMAADRRAAHNAIERARRESLNDRFLILASALPNMSSVKRPSKSAVVNKALEFVQTSQANEKELRKQNEELKRQVEWYRSRIGGQEAPTNHVEPRRDNPPYFQQPASYAPLSSSPQSHSSINGSPLVESHSNCGSSPASSVDYPSPKDTAPIVPCKSQEFKSFVDQNQMNYNNPALVAMGIQNMSPFGLPGIPSNQMSPEYFSPILNMCAPEQRAVLMPENLHNGPNMNPAMMWKPQDLAPLQSFARSANDWNYSNFVV